MSFATSRGACPGSRRRRAAAGAELGIGRQRGGGVALLQRAGLGIERERRHRRGQFVEQIDELVVLRHDDVARARALLHLHGRRRVRGKLAALLVEHELEDLVGAEMRHEHILVGVSVMIACALRAVGITWTARRPCRPCRSGSRPPLRASDSRDLSQSPEAAGQRATRPDLAQHPQRLDHVRAAALACRRARRLPARVLAICADKRLRRGEIEDLIAAGWSPTT